MIEISHQEELTEYILNQDSRIYVHLNMVINYIREKTAFSCILNQVRDLPQSTNGTHPARKDVKHAVSELNEDEAKILQEYLQVVSAYLKGQNAFSAVDRAINAVVDLNPKTPKLSPPGQEFYSGRRPLIELYQGL
jgi:hypothetical protein